MTNDSVPRFVRDRQLQRETLTTLRVATSSELLDRALRLYQRHGSALLSATVIPVAFGLCGWAFLTSIAYPRVQAALAGVGSVGGAIAATIGAVVVAIPLFVLGCSWTVGVASAVSGRAIRGEVVDMDAVRSDVTKRLTVVATTVFRTQLSAWGAPVVSFLLIALGSGTYDKDSSLGGGLMGLGVLGAVASLVWTIVAVGRDFIAPSVAQNESGGSTDALRRARRLMKARARSSSGADSVAGAIVMLGFVFLVVYAGFAASLELIGLESRIADAFPAGVIRTVLVEACRMSSAFFAVWTVGPMWGCLATTIYIDRRIRLEGYDVDALAALIPTRDLD